MLLFKGEDAVRKTRSVIGNISAERRGGETIRDTYGDLVIDENDQVRYFEPAVLAAPNVEEAEVKVKLWAQYSDTDGGIVENTIALPAGREAAAHAGAHQAGQFPVSDRPAGQRD